MVLAKDIEVNIYAPEKITTSNVNLKEGDSVDFAISKDIYINNKLFLKKDVKVTGIITEMHDNNFVCEPATVVLDNFRATNPDGKPVKFKSHLYITGRSHWMFTQFMVGVPEVIRGGEVQIKSNKTFTIYLDEKI